MRTITLNEDDMRKPKVGDVVCDCRYKHLKITAIDDDGDTVTLEDGSVCSYIHCCDVPDHEWVHPDPGVVVNRSDLESVAYITGSVELLVDGEYIDFRPVADIIQDDNDERIVNDILRENALRNQHNPQANANCPVCGDSGGFHLDDKHRNVDPKYLLEKGWHNE